MSCKREYFVLCADTLDLINFVEYWDEGCLMLEVCADDILFFLNTMITLL